MATVRVEITISGQKTDTTYTNTNCTGSGNKKRDSIVSQEPTKYRSFLQKRKYLEKEEKQKTLGVDRLENRFSLDYGRKKGKAIVVMFRRVALSEILMIITSE